MEKHQQNILFKQLTGLQLRQFGKRKSNWIVFLFFLCTGLYALYQGYVDKKAKTVTISAFRQHSDSLLNAMKAGISADTTTAEGKAAYSRSSRLNPGLWNSRLPSFKLPVSTAIFNIGQGDVFPYYYLFAAENFEMQWLKQTEIANPLRSLSGHFDISFWIVYLLPLMILLLLFNALSGERDNGNWRLIAAQGISEKAWLETKLIAVALLATALLLVIAIAGLVINLAAFGHGFVWSDGLFFLSAAVYLCFWLSMFYFINTLRRPTAYNALVSGVAWIAVCFVLPVVISKLAAATVPVDNTTVSSFSRRPQDPRIDSDNLFAAGFIKQLAKEEEVYRNADTGTSSPAFYLRVYHAWHLLLHKERWPVVQQYFHQVEKRQQVTNWSTLINPAASTDGYLTALADNDAAAFHHFTNETEALHKGLQRTFFGKLFHGNSFSQNEYKSLPEFTYFRNNLPFSIVAYFVFMMILGTGLVKIANRQLKEML